FAGTSKPGAVHESGETDAALFAVLIFICEAFAFRVVVAELQRAIEQAVHIDALANHLAGRSGLAFLNKVATAKLFRRESDGARDLVHVTFEGKDALRRAETAKRAVRWNVCRNSLAMNAHVWARIRTGRVNRSARKHDRRECAVGAAVDYEIDLHRDEF